MIHNPMSDICKYHYQKIMRNGIVDLMTGMLTTSGIGSLLVDVDEEITEILSRLNPDRSDLMPEAEANLLFGKGVRIIVKMYEGEDN